MEKMGKFVSKDYISNLSSETLVSILSQLTLREAVATSILGRRWRPLLNDYLPQFSCCLSQLQVLTLELIDGFVDEVGSKLFPPLHNLKKLEHGERIISLD
ncbi:hypothetical protein CMV_026041 [Castanea mollissima]|uniref:F-box domain-containing protein n=1 Tax=Castanea mollissima TaxID=60419 RepID=A0A8J4VFU3_9ROSI|nr:hypothetical protein CMV_026041 [Castanea mollissima]